MGRLSTVSWVWRCLSLFVLLLAALAQSTVHAESTNLPTGSLLVVNFDKPQDRVILAVMATIPAGTVISFTDKGWNNIDQKFMNDVWEGRSTWTVAEELRPGTLLTLNLGSGGRLSNITKGTVTNLTNISGYSGSGENVDQSALSSWGDQLFIYQGEDSNPYFIFGFNMARTNAIDAPLYWHVMATTSNGWTDRMGAKPYQSHLPSGAGSQNSLQDGVSALGIATRYTGATGAWSDPNQHSVAAYKGPMTRASVTEWRTRILTKSNWTGSDSAGFTGAIDNVTGASLLIDSGDPVYVSNITANVVDGQQPINRVIPIEVQFNVPVVVSGTPRISLNSGGVASYSSGSGSDRLIFNYTVANDQFASDLDVSSNIQLNGGSITAGTSHPAELNLPRGASTEGSLAYNKDILIDSQAPQVTLTPTTQNVYLATAQPKVTLSFNKPVQGVSLDNITLIAGTELGSLSNLQQISSTVWTADFTAAANAKGSATVALVPAGITDSYGNALTATPTVTVVVDTVRPKITSISLSAWRLKTGDTMTVDYREESLLAISNVANDYVSVGAFQLFNLGAGMGGWPNISIDFVMRATVTPNANQDYVKTRLRFDLTQLVALGSGNRGEGEIFSPAFEVDTLAPRLTVPAGMKMHRNEVSLVRGANGEPLLVAEASRTTLKLTGQTADRLSLRNPAVADEQAVEVSGNNSNVLTLTGEADALNTVLMELQLERTSGTHAITVQATDRLGNFTNQSLQVQLLNHRHVVTSVSDSDEDQRTSATLAEDKNDGSGLSLREALYWAQAGEFITFDLDPTQGKVIVPEYRFHLEKANLTIDGQLDGGERVIFSGQISGVVFINYIPNTTLYTTLRNMEVRDGADTFGAINSSSPLILDGVVMRNNGSESVSSGAIFSTHHLKVRNSHFEGNKGLVNGGAISQDNQSISNATISIFNSSFVGNSSENGGAISFAPFEGSGNSLLIVNSVFYANNNSGQLGSAIAVFGSGSLTMYNSTVVGNSSRQIASAVYAKTGAIYNSVIAGNAVRGGLASPGNALAQGEYNDLGGDLTAMANNYFGSIDLNNTPAVNINNTIDSSLSTLHLSAMHTVSDARVYFEPLAESALRNAGNNSFLPVDSEDIDNDGSSSEVLPLDFLGRARIIDHTVDIGAVEFSPEFTLQGFDNVHYVENDEAVVLAPALIIDSVYPEYSATNGDYRSLRVTVALDESAGELLWQLPVPYQLQNNRIYLNAIEIAQLIGSTTSQTLQFTDQAAVAVTQQLVTDILRSLRFSAVDNNDPPAGIDVTWTFTGLRQSLPFNQTITVTQVNDAPVITADAIDSQFIEAGSSVALFNQVAIDTVEAVQQISSVQLTVSGVRDGAQEKLLLGATVIPLQVKASTSFAYPAFNSASYTVTQQGSNLLVTFTALASSNVWQEALQALRYENSQVFPAVGERSFVISMIKDNGSTANNGVDSSATTIAARTLVQQYNRTPVISGTPAVVVNQEASYQFVPVASDENVADSLSFTIENLPSWLAFDAQTGALTGTPTQQDVGLYSDIVISVTDGELTATLPAFSIDVIDINIAPVISGAPQLTINQGEQYLFAPVANDADGDELSFSATNLPAWLSINSATGEVTGVPAQADVGSHNNIVITVSDGELSASLAAFSIDVINVNVAPVIQGAPALSVVADMEYQFTPVAFDDDGDALTFSVENLPQWLAFDEQTGSLNGTPTMDDIGSYSGIEISVTDGEFTSSLSAFAIEVRVPAFALDQFDLTGLAKAERLGSALAFADLNRDYYPELLIGSPQRAVTLNGKLAKNVGAIDVLDMANAAEVTRNAFAGSVKNQRFASSIAVVADQDGDGVADLVIGKTHVGKFGEVVLHSGLDGSLIRVLLAADKALPVVDSQVDLKGRFGEVVAVADVDQDGVEDLIIGMPQSTSKTPAKLAKAGAVVVFDGLSDTVKYVRFGSTKAELFGAALDVDRGANQLLVGSPQYSPMIDGKKVAKAGRVQLFDANDGASTAQGEVAGHVKNQLFGDAVASFAQDINGDNVNDWAVAQPGSKTAAQVQLYSGLNTQAFAERAVTAPFKRQAIRLASGADVNADRVNDLAIGLPQAAVEQMQANNKVKKLKQAGGVMLISGESF